MGYDLSGTFVEACDCYVICPCWLQDLPDDGHCTGLFAWQLAPGSMVEGVDVGGLSVVAVSTHGTSRAGGRTSTVLYLDERAGSAQFDRLGQAFGGQLSGPLAGLATVSGEVLAVRRAAIELDPVASRPLRGRVGSGWTLTVTVDPAAAGTPGEPAGPVEVLRSTGVPLMFDQGPAITLRHTALSLELGIDTAPPSAGPAPGAVVGQQGQELVVRVGELAGGYLDVSGRSGMRGTFGYTWGDPTARSPEPDEGPAETTPAAAARR